MKDFNIKLKTLRKESGLSQKEISKVLGVTISAYSNYEQGIRIPTLGTFYKICELFHVSADYLLGFSDFE
ncbi:MAG: helix-turn-helix domain-containing protein [Clostridia bacterium]